MDPMLFILELLKAALLGIVQGITEWLPVSSTGHMILLDEILQLQVSPEFMEMFRVVIQLGSILAVLVLYFGRLSPVLTHKTPAEQKKCLKLWGRILLAVIPAGVAGVLLDDWLDTYLYNYITVAITLIVYGVAFLVIEKVRAGKPAKYEEADDIDAVAAVKIGCFQMLSLIPGTSRSGSTILGGMLCGVARPAGAEFSFFLALPVMAGASLLKLLKFGFTFTGAELAILAVGTVVAFVTSMVAIRFLVAFVRRHTFSAFGYYRIALGALVLAAGLLM